ncbi:hypothetical protein KFK09_019834 [Dendrobium nobile]|uniref:Uncharacterized protein n=1 Tax=Dendrobium nobile TaxID=94219 RepID=A0A8T3AQL9_DENNO|nr:hypothetical protein KFK09_019834 [Dendrobium nobile]
MYIGSSASSGRFDRRWEFRIYGLKRDGQGRCRLQRLGVELRLKIESRKIGCRRVYGRVTNGLKVSTCGEK